MRQLYIFCVFILVFSSVQCTYVPKEYKEIARRIKNSPRDPRLFGAWKEPTPSGDTVLLIFNQDATMDIGVPKYDEQKRIIRYEVASSPATIYYCAYDGMIRSFIFQAVNIIAGRQGEEVNYYKIVGDTLLWSIDRSYIDDFPKVKVENPVIIWK